MGDIKFPLKFEELADSSSGFYVSNVWDEIPSDVDDQIGAFQIDLDGMTQDNIDVLYNLVNSMENISDQQKKDLLESLFDIATQSFDQCQANDCSASIKSTTKLASYFLFNMCHKMEKIVKAQGPSENSSKGKGKSTVKPSKVKSFVWSEWRALCLDFFRKMLGCDQSYMWSMGIIHENFLMLPWTYALELLENKPEGVSGVGKAEIAIRKLCMEVLSLSLKQLEVGSSHGNGVTSFVTALVESICRHEHMGPVIAELCASARVGSVVCADLMSEIGGMNMTELSKSGGAGVKNVGVFLTSLAESSPDVITLYLPLIMNHLDSDVYQIRSAIVSAMGFTLAFIYRQCAKCLAEQGDEQDQVSDAEREKTVNIRSLIRTRDDMLDILVERTRDTSSYTRCAVLRTWSYLVEEEALPVDRIGSIAEVALDRLNDKTAAVRKGAVVLMTALLDFNPFSGNLSVAHYSHLKEEIQKRLAARVDALSLEKKAIVKESNDGSESEDEDENKVEKTDEKDLSEFEDDPEVSALGAELGKCMSCLELLTSIDAAVPIIEKMLSSKTSSDVVEALRFSARAVNFSIKGSARCLQSSFSLIWHHEEAIQAEILSTFINVYITDGSDNSTGNALVPAEIASNLVQLSLRCNLSDLTSFEKIVGELFAKDKIAKSTAVVNALWQMASCAHSQRSQLFSEGKVEAISTESLHGPLQVLKMISKSSPKGLFTAQRILFICNSCFACSTASDFADTVKVAAQCLQAAPSYIECATESSKEMSDLMRVYVSAYEKIGTILSDSMQIFDTEKMTRSWFGICEESMHALFHVHPCPDEFLSRLISSTYSSWRSSCAEGVESSKVSEVAMCRLSRLLFIVGQGALCSLIYTEKIASISKKAMEAKERQVKIKEKVPGADEGAYEDNKEVDAMEEEMGMAAAADAEHEREFNNVLEMELVCNEDNILGRFHALTAYIVADATKLYSKPLLRETAILTLCRYMSVSSLLCEKYLPLFFTVLEREKSEAIRTSMIIAAGDLCFRFPNSLEPWTAHMYSRLTDSNLLVRYNTLMVLTHLILNDMIKVKGQVSAMVLCLTDQSAKVRSLARLFFTELSKRSNNPVYNLMGDVISNLSLDKDGDGSLHEDDKLDNDGGCAVLPVAANLSRQLTSEEFTNTMQFLLSFVTKDRQADSLLERLIVRMAAAHGMGQKRKLAYCISRLPITSKGVKKMTELLRQSKECLLDKEILEHLNTAVSKTKKTVVKDGDGEIKAAATEFDEFVASILNNDEENIVPLSLGEENKQLSSNKSTGGKKSKAASTKTTKKKSKKLESWEYDDENNEKDDLVDSESDEEQLAGQSSMKGLGSGKQGSSKSKRGVLKVSN